MSKYSDDVLKNVRKSWSSFKVEHDYSQRKAAKILGINQSAFSQYLRGEIPLNTDFLHKFSSLINTELKDLGVDSETPVQKVERINVRYNSFGEKVDNVVVATNTIVSLKHCFGIIVTHSREHLQKGTVYLVEEKSKVHEGELCVAISKNDLTIGTLENTTEGWGLINIHNKQEKFVPVISTTNVHRVGSIYLPETQGKPFAL